MLNLDIDGFLLSQQFLATLAAFVATLLGFVVQTFLGGVLGNP